MHGLIGPVMTSRTGHWTLHSDTQRHRFVPRHRVDLLRPPAMTSFDLAHCPEIPFTLCKVSNGKENIILAYRV